MSNASRAEIEKVRRSRGFRDARTGQFVEKPKPPPMRSVIKGGWKWEETLAPIKKDGGEK